MSQNPAGKGKEERNPLALPEGINKRCDLPPEAYWHNDRSDYTPHAVRPSYNTSGTDIRVAVNQFRVQTVTGKDVYQYDLAIRPEPKGVIVYKKAWATKMIQGKLAQYKGPWLHDSRKLVWSSINIPGFTCEVDLGADEGRPGRKNNVVVFELKQTCKVRMEALKAYLDKRTSWDNTVLECISFLDHALRQGPSERMRLIKRTLFDAGTPVLNLNTCTQAMKGIYSAIRLNETIKSGGTGLGVNVDVANQTFWLGQKFEQLARNFLSCYSEKNWGNIDYAGMREVLKPVKVQKGNTTTFVMSDALKVLRRMQNIRFEVRHRGSTPGRKEYKVKTIAFDAKFGELGACARTVTFTKKMPDGSEKEYNIADYYFQQYKSKIQHWYFPLIESTNGGFFPMEVCEVVPFNPYPFKLDSNQTTAMISFAVQRPDARKSTIMTNVANLQWEKDPYLNHFGIKINATMPMVPAKLLQNPTIQYGNKPVDPKMTGRWDLRGVKFVSPNREPLKSWAVCVMGGCVDKPTALNFAKAFKNAYVGHGGRVDGAQPPAIIVPDRRAHPDAVVAEAYNTCGQTFKADPQIIFFILSQKASQPYDTMKMHADCRWGVLSQMVLAKHARTASPQYLSNVSMKVNAKLGGQTSKIASKVKGPVFFKVPTMMIGVDVSHGNTGASSASTAAMCASMDPDAAVYDTEVQTNGFGVEILQPANMHSMLAPLAIKWRQKNKVVPQHVFYMRDGVSEGQYAHVMEFEVGEMRKVFKEYLGGATPKITVIICTKRHHIRFFPERGDRNKNCLPGTLVEKEVTHPFHYDFYLCSHVAIQGTARPVHYNVLFDECALKPEDLQRILYHQCYQYCRSTTPVSLHPAVYYAHLAGTRARHHESLHATAHVPKNSPYLWLSRPGLMSKGDSGGTTTSRNDQAQPAQLMKIGSGNQRQGSANLFKAGMWWV